MGTLGVQEMIVIFLLALVLFGPKKLPELGRTIGKALTEFRRASSDLKATFEREMQNLERETDGVKKMAHSTANEIYAHTDYFPYDESGQSSGNALNAPAPADPSHQIETHEDNSHLNAAETPATTSTPSTVGASEIPGAESQGTTHEASVATATLPAVEGTVPRSMTTEPTHNS
jgi:TatA/E family protein of Tat protein translocase